MKKTFFILAITTALTGGTIFSGCKSPAEKADDAQQKVQDAKAQLDSAQNEANEAEKKAATAEEWKTFKIESEAKISSNEATIAELREKMKTSGKTMDALYEKRIDALEKQNNDLKTKIETYDQSQSNWESFKREFNHDMDELGKSLKDLTVDNTK